MNGVTRTFVTGTPAGKQTQIGVSLHATLTALASDLNGAADAQVSKCTYTTNTAVDRLEILIDTAGTSGNSFNLTASAGSNGTVSFGTFTGGGCLHEWLSGGDDIPSFTFEIGHPKLITPVFFRHLGLGRESLAFEIERQRPANGTVQLVAAGRQPERRVAPPAAACSPVSARFSPGYAMRAALPGCSRTRSRRS